MAKSKLKPAAAAAARQRNKGMLPTSWVLHSAAEGVQDSKIQPPPRTFHFPVVQGLLSLAEALQLQLKHAQAQEADLVLDCKRKETQQQGEVGNNWSSAERMKERKENGTEQAELMMGWNSRKCEKL